MNCREGEWLPEKNLICYDEDSLAIQHSKDSEFDINIKALWEHAMEKGIFRYKLGTLETKILPGKYGFVAQLNIQRAIERRKPQFICNVLEPFNSELFNFTKISEKEILTELVPSHWCDSENEKYVKSPHLSVIVNVSPLEYCNCLLVPNVLGCFPQILTIDALRFAIETLLLSSSQALRIGYNSLGAYASVNHLHFHMYFLQHQLYLETACVRKFAGDCFVICDYPAEGFAFQLLDHRNVSSVVCSAMSLIHVLLEKNIAHNVFITRGVSFFSTPENCDRHNAIRIYVWARKSSFGSKNDLAFNPALCELAGHFPIKTKEHFETTDEKYIEDILYDICHETYTSICSDVQKLFSQQT